MCILGADCQPPLGHWLKAGKQETMSSQLIIRTLARSSGLWARPVSTTSIRYADNDDKSMYDKVKDKAGEQICTTIHLANFQYVAVKQNRHLHQRCRHTCLISVAVGIFNSGQMRVARKINTCAALYCNVYA